MPLFDSSSEPVGGLVLIREIVVPTGGQASIDFTSIPQTYRHLEIYYIGQSENAGALGLQCRVNGDSGNNYYDEKLEGAGATASSGKTEASNSGRVGVLPKTSEAQPAYGTITVPFYARTDFRKVLLGRHGGYWDSEGRAGVHTTLWTNTAAITQITLFPATASDVSEKCVFTMYGVG